ncbi:MAG: PEP-CTERM sorting domain-containing protein [Sedimentisphaerales bacterium]
MKKKLVGIFVAFLLVTMPVNASIDSYNCDDDGDGVIVMSAVALTDNGLSGEDFEYTLAMDCAPTSLSAGHVQGDFVAPTDPKVWIAETIDNQTTFAWTDYHITIGMTQPFTISTSVIAPDDWSSVVIQPIAGMLPNGGGAGYVGVINYYAAPDGSPIAIGDSGDFGFKITFDGNASFCTEQYPTIPEPATMALLSFGALALIRRRK